MVKKQISEIGTWLRKLRFDRNESQDDMAVKLGVTAPYISLMEYRQPVTKKIAVKIIREYNLAGRDKDNFVDIVTRDVVRRYWGKK